MRAFFSILVFSILCALQAAPELPETVVLKRPLALYAEPESGSQIILTMEEGKKISLRNHNKVWAKIEFSGNMNVWVASCFLKNGTFTKNVIFRTAPTAAASRLTVNGPVSSQKVEIIETDPSGYWNKVSLNFSFTGYIPFVELEKCLKPRENTYRIKRLPFISTAVGRLLPLETPINKATHKLVYKVNDAEYLVAYVVPDKVNLKLWEDWMIYLSGERIWDVSSETPFMKGANIFPAYR